MLQCGLCGGVGLSIAVVRSETSQDAMTDRKPHPADETIDPALLNNLLEAITPQAPPTGLRDKILAWSTAISHLK